MVVTVMFAVVIIGIVVDAVVGGRSTKQLQQQQQLQPEKDAEMKCHDGDEVDWGEVYDTESDVCDQYLFSHYYSHHFL